MNSLSPNSDCHEVFTIGYQGRNISEFIEILNKNMIKVLIDVRASGFSRKPYFSRGRLKEKIEQSKIEFVSLPEVGTPKELREYLKKTGDYETFFRRYSSHIERNKLLPALEKNINGERVCMMCFEREAEKCHRSVLAEKLKENMNVIIGHI